MTITLEVRHDRLDSYTDEHLANLWAAAQASTVPFGDREICQFVERLGLEIIRRWLRAQRPTLGCHQISHFYRRMIDKAAGEWKDGEWKDGEWKDGEWKDGEWFPLHPAPAEKGVTA